MSDKDSNYIEILFSQGDTHYNILNQLFIN